MQKLIFLELNEINFEYVEYYTQKGLLKNFKKIIDTHGCSETTSEKNYDELEPWIQWPSVRTGLSYSEHGIFRLGDIVDSNIKQHWEKIENHGYSVAAVSPINAVNRTKNSPFWISDPWTDTVTSGSKFVKRLTKAIGQVVNDNVKKKISFESKITLIEAVLSCARGKDIGRYLTLISNAVFDKPGSRAIFLDQLLATLFIKLWLKHTPDFSTLFLNGGAHLQHHYMFNSAAYKGANANPNWYVSAEIDPLFDMLNLYDQVLENILKLDVRVMICTGLRQVPFEKPIYYWRLREHDEFLKRLNINFKRVLPRMSRDFLIEFDSDKDVKYAISRLSSIKDNKGLQIFGELEQRNKSVFVVLTYPDKVDKNMEFEADGVCIFDFHKVVEFVAIKNAHHDSLGYFIDTETKKQEKVSIPLVNISDKILENFSISNTRSNDI